MKKIIEDEFYNFKDVEDKIIEIHKAYVQYKRENLRNNIKKYDLKKIEEVLVKYGCSLNSRAEEIPVSVFAEISNSLAD